MSLEQFVAKAHGQGVFAWYVDASMWRESHRPYEIARQAGLGPPPTTLVSLEASLAAKVFAYVRSESLTHGRMRYRASLLSECRELINELGNNAGFYSNSSFEDCFRREAGPNVWGFTPLTDFDLDTGVIGSSVDGRCGFAFWRGENS